MPVSLESLNHYGKELQEKGDFYSAAQVYENAYTFIYKEADNEEYKEQLSNKDIIKDIIYNLSFCFEKIKNYEKASYYIKHAYAMFPDDSKITYSVLKSYLLQNNLKKSANLYIKVANITSEEEKAKILLYSEEKRNSYKYGSTFIKILKNVLALDLVNEEDKQLFNNKIVEIDSSLKHPKISTCIITKNDEKTIRQTLESFQKVSFEIIVFDLGSTDETKSIAAEYASVNSFEFKNDYSEVKNAMIKKSKSDWLLFANSNDFLTKETEEDLLMYLHDQETEDPNSVYYINKIDVEKMGNQLIFYYKPFLFRNNQGIHFRRSVHEEVFHPEKELKKIYCYSLEMKNQTKQKSEEEFFESEMNYRKMLDQAILHNQDTADNYYYYHFSAINYSIHGETKKALEDHYKALGLYKQKFPDKKDDFYLYILMAIVKFLSEKTNNFDATKAFVDKVLDIKPDYPDALYYLGTYYEKTGNTEKAVEYYQKALELLQDKWHKIKNTELPSIGESLVYTLSEKFENFVW